MSNTIVKIPAPPRKRKVKEMASAPLKKVYVANLKTTKTVYPVVTYCSLQFNLKIIPSDISLFREEVLRCIPNAKEREMFSNETIGDGGKQKNIVRYPKIQFRVRNGYAALWAMQEGVENVQRFLREHKHKFAWRGKPFNLKLMEEASVQESIYPVRVFNPKVAIRPVVYHLYYYIPFTNAGNNKNYNWIKDNRNLPDTDKTKKMEQLLTNHLCTFLYYAGGYIPKQKIMLSILDKKPLDHVAFDGRRHIAYDIRYTVNLYLPDFIGLGNKISHGYGWQRLENR